MLRPTMQQANAATLRECPSCNTEAEPGARYCALCGRNLSGPATGGSAPVTQTPRGMPRVLRWTLYVVVGFLALIGLSSVVTSGSRQTASQQSAAAIAPTANLDATVQVRV